MPVFSTLGALTYTKVYLGDNWYYYLDITPRTSNTRFNDFQVNNDNIYIGGSLPKVANVSQYNPNFINVAQSNFSLPTDPYHAFYASGGSGTISAVGYDAVSEKIFLTGFQDISGQTASVTRVLHSNLALDATYVDLPTTPTNLRRRTPSSVIPLSGNIYTVIGESEEISSPAICYITNFTGNTKNWAKTIANTTGPVEGKLTSANNYIINTNDNIIEISSNGNSILRQYVIGNGSGYRLAAVETDPGNNIYYTAGSLNITDVVKLDSGGNIVWQKQMSGNTNSNSGFVVESLYYADGNLFASGQANAPSGNVLNGVPLALMSFDANTGNVNWQRRFRNTSSNSVASETVIKYDNSDLYISATQFMIKVPSNGAIPGNGNYAGNLTYQASNVVVSNANVTFTTGNLVLANAVSTSVIGSNITANTANLYTFNSTRLA